MAEPGRVDLTVDRRVARVSIHRPPLNVLDLPTIRRLAEIADEIAVRDDVQLAVVTGEGKAFSAGVAVEIHLPESIPAMLEQFHGALRRWWRLPCLTLAAVDGYCLGGGMELAAVCDFVLATENSQFGQPEIQVGCYPPVAAALYPHRLGPGRTLDLITTGRRIDALRAEAWGFVTRLAPPGELEMALARWSEEITSQSAIAQELAKKSVRATLGDSFERALVASESIYLQEMAVTHDVEEGARAFLDKRPPRWRHE